MSGVLVTVSGSWVNRDGVVRRLEHGERTHDGALVWRFDGGPWRLVNTRRSSSSRAVDSVQRPRVMAD